MVDGKSITWSAETAAGSTATFDSLPVMLELLVSVAVTDSTPAVSRTTFIEAFPRLPAGNVNAFGSFAFWSLLVNSTVPT